MNESPDHLSLSLAEHALCRPTILSDILSYLESLDVSTLRQVSKSILLLVTVSRCGTFQGHCVTYDVNNTAVVQTALHRISSCSFAHTLNLPVLMSSFTYTNAVIYPSNKQYLSDFLSYPSLLPPRALYLKYIDADQGWGLFSACFIPHKTNICIYAGEYISSSEAKRRYKDVYDPQGLNYILTVKESDVRGNVLVTNIDATRYGGIGRFINHSCQPNLEVLMHRPLLSKEMPSDGETDGARGEDKVKGEYEKVLSLLLAVPLLQSSRHIYPNEELNFDYSSDDRVDTSLGKRGHVGGGQSLTLQLKPCRCGKSICRGFLPFHI